MNSEQRDWRPSADDVINHLVCSLHAAGYVIHNGDSNTGETVNDRSGSDWWFTWTDGKCDIECGSTWDHETAAIMDACSHWFANAKIPAEAVMPSLNARRWQMSAAERERISFAAQKNADDTGKPYAVFFDTSGAVRIEPAWQTMNIDRQQVIGIYNPSEEKRDA